MKTEVKPQEQKVLLLVVAKFVKYIHIYNIYKKNLIILTNAPSSYTRLEIAKVCTCNAIFAT